MSASAELVSTRGVGCSDDCSKVSFTVSEKSGVWLRYLLARGLAPAILDSVHVDAFRAELVAPAKGVRQGRRGIIPSGSAMFALSGKSFGSTAIVTGKNSSDIVFTPTTRGGWSVDPFELEYTDPSGETLQFIVASTIWE